ncbi:MAG: sialate O-acetylesterase [Akkermansiaceae bacterium]|nr:sialate O-acetylesterase [Akkermansiaceae bacterium]
MKSFSLAIIAAPLLAAAAPALCGLLVGCLAGTAHAEVRLPTIFSDHMVVQRELPVPVWGWADPGEKITVNFGGQNVACVAGKDGGWAVRLRPMNANASPQELIVSAGNTIKLTDVMVGDVWMVSGQSNAAFGLGGCKAPGDISSADFPLIRFSGCWEHFANTPQKDGGAPWQVMSPATAAACSAMGFYFARKVQPEAGVPIGLLTCAVGGTDIENWMSPEAIHEDPGNAEVSKSVKDTIAEWERELPSSKATPGQRPAYYPVDQPIGLDLTVAWLAEVRGALKSFNTPLDPAFLEFEAWVDAARTALNKKETVPIQPELQAVGTWLLGTSLTDRLKRIPVLPYPIDRHSVGGHGWFRTQSLYNGMIHPFIPIQIRGMLWYQGEGANGVPYFNRMRALIQTMRKEKGRDFPVYLVQLPNWESATDNPEGDPLHKWPGIRELMLKCLQIPKTGVVVTIDVGDSGDLHPVNKKDVGERLALWALAKDYGKDNVFSGPLFKEVKIGQGEVRLSFAHTGSGLMVGRKDGVNPATEDPEGTLKRFAIAGGDRKWFWATARIDGSEVVVSSPEVPKPVAVRYAFSMNPEGCNLYNKEGLPASPFRTDSW